LIENNHVDILDPTPAVSQNLFNMYKKQLRAEITSKQFIFCSYDRLHPLSGLSNKLLAFNQLLETYPRLRKDVCLVQYVVT